MKVKQLLAMLSSQDPEAEVKFCAQAHDAGWLYTIYANIGAIEDREDYLQIHGAGEMTGEYDG